jgi:hypothetical protein
VAEALRRELSTRTLIISLLVELSKFSRITRQQIQAAVGGGNYQFALEQL